MSALTKDEIEGVVRALLAQYPRVPKSLLPLFRHVGTRVAALVEERLAADNARLTRELSEAREASREILVVFDHCSTYGCTCEPRHAEPDCPHTCASCEVWNSAMRHLEPRNDKAITDALSAYAAVEEGK